MQSEPGRNDGEKNRTAKQVCCGFTRVFCSRKPSVLGRRKPAEDWRRGRASFAWEHLIQGQDPKKQGEWSSAVHCKCIEVFALGYSQSITSLKAFQSSLKETLGLPTPSHTWSVSRQPLAGEKGMSSLFSEEVCFESQCNLTPWIRRDSARGLRQKYIPFLKWLEKSSNLCGKAGEMGGEKRKMTCISGLCLPDI